MILQSKYTGFLVVIHVFHGSLETLIVGVYISTQVKTSCSSLTVMIHHGPSGPNLVMPAISALVTKR